MLFAISFYHLFNMEKTMILNGFDFRESMVAVEDVQAMEWINLQEIKQKTFLTSDYNSFAFCPFPALTQNKVYYCSDLIADGQGFDRTVKENKINELLDDASKINEWTEDIDYIFVYGRNYDVFKNVINYCNTNELCGVIYSQSNSTIIRLEK